MPMSRDSEQRLVQEPALEYLGQQGWEILDGWKETVPHDGVSSIGRPDKRSVLLWPRLRDALHRLNPTLPPEAFASAVEELSRERGAMSIADACREVYKLVKDGVPVKFQTADGEQTDRVRVIDWEDPLSNDFVAVSELTVTGEMEERRPDIVGFVNGLPFVVFELKKSTVAVDEAYKKNIVSYRNDIPQLFYFNAVVILSNGTSSRVGSATSSWSDFTPWKRVAREDEEGSVSLKTVVEAVCDRRRLLDLVESYTLFTEGKRGLQKIIARYHQYLGVENALANMADFEKREGRLGVFWHTQGSGKSFSMVFFAQKVLRKLAGNWTFLVVTDRRDLDDQMAPSPTRAS